MEVHGGEEYSSSALYGVSGERHARPHFNPGKGPPVPDVQEAGWASELVCKQKSSPATRHEGAWGERRYRSYSFTTSAIDGGEWSASRPGRALPPGKGPRGTHWRGGWVAPRAGLDTEDRGKILYPRRGSNPDRPVVQFVVRHYTA
jgi:hypothetical protein